VDQADFLRCHQGAVGGRRGARGVGREAGLGVFRLQRYRGLAAAALGGIAAFPVVARFVRRDPKQPGLKLAFALKRLDAANDRKKSFLRDFLNILAAEIAA
jgi:hypothetical protein